MIPVLDNLVVLLMRVQDPIFRGHNARSEHSVNRKNRYILLMFIPICQVL